jgi:hypothetical protein
MHRNSIHDIKPSLKLKKSKGYESRRLEHEEDEVAPRRVREDYDNSDYGYEEKKRGGKGIWYVAIACILFLIFALSVLFAGATVEVTPRVGNIELDELLTAKKDPIDSKDLSFEMVALEGEDSVSISSTEKKYVEKKATGKVRLFNDYSEKPQSLLIDTRLVATDGKIYKTVKALTIPGKVGNTPGSIDVDIYADVAGEEYNKKDADLKVFGFKNSPKENAFYARTLTPIDGGAKGEMYVVSPEDEVTQKEALKESLKAKLLAEARAELPEGFVIYNNAVILDLDQVQSDSTGENEVKLTQKGSLHAFVFKKENITRNLVKDLVADYDNNKVYIPTLETLSVELMSSTEITPSKVDTISLSIKDSAKVIWEIDEEKLKESLLGIKKRKFESALAAFKNIDRAELSVKPFWKNSLPSKASQIKVINTVSAE